MSVAADRVQETTVTTGTGNITLAGAATGYQSFNTAFSTGVPFDYCIVAVDGSGNPTGQWEVGTGHLSGSTTLVRDVVWSSSTGATGAGGQVNFGAGTSNVFADWPAIQGQGAASTNLFELQFGTI